MSWSDERWNIGWIEIVSGQLRDGSGMAKHTHCALVRKEKCGMWYVIQTETGREQQLVKCIENILAGNSYRACFVIGQECVWRNAGKLKAYQKPLFPSYVIADTVRRRRFFWHSNRFRSFRAYCEPTVTSGRFGRKRGSCSAV